MTNVGFKALTAVVMKGSIIWDVTACNSLKYNQCFRGACHLHLQSQKISRAQNQHENRL
jgi:hypothetical protein